jgi:hypothetical protein
LLEFEIAEANSDLPLMGFALNLEYSVVKALTFAMKKF